VAGDERGLSEEFIHSMEGSLDAVRDRWDSLAEFYNLEDSPVFWMLLNSLVIVAAEKETAPSTIDTYLRHMALHRHSLLNLYREQQGKTP